jgi:hypothetical protein
MLLLLHNKSFLKAGIGALKVRACFCLSFLFLVIVLGVCFPPCPQPPLRPTTSSLSVRRCCSFSGNAFSLSTLPAGYQEGPTASPLLPSTL